MDDIPRGKSSGWGDFFRTTLKRLMAFGAGYTGKAGLDFVFDNVAYPAVIIWLSRLWGEGWGSAAAWAIMTPLSVPFNLFEICLYDRLKKDWFSFEELKTLKGRAAEPGWRGWITKLLHKGDALAFLILSIKEDPTMTMLYLRRGSHQYNGMSQRDWKIFLASTIVANLYWTVRWSAIIVAFRWIWQLGSS